MRYPLCHWGESCITAWLGLRAALCVRLHGAMAARRIPDPKVGGSNPSGVSFCPVSGTLFALRLSARTMSRAVALRSVRGGSMAEWLRRLIRNQLGVARGSSNLSAVDFFFVSALVELLARGKKEIGAVRESNPRPLAPKARIIPLDQRPLQW